VSEKGRQAIHDSQPNAKALDGPMGLLVASVKLSEDLAELVDQLDAEIAVHQEHGTQVAVTFPCPPELPR
jgi:hypothetical protein